MQLYDNKIRLTDLANELKISSSALRQHLKNKSPLKEGAEKFGHRLTDDYLLDINSTLKFLDWLRLKGRKVKMEDIQRIYEELT